MCLQKVLGKGGFGIVYYGVDDNQSQVAIKQINYAQMITASHLKQCLNNEIQAMLLI
jgi:serine/threonine protein kinase